MAEEDGKDEGVTGECETGQLQDVEEIAVHLDAEEKDIHLQEEAGCQDEVKSQDEEERCRHKQRGRQ